MLVKEVSKESDDSPLEDVDFYTYPLGIKPRFIEDFTETLKINNMEVDHSFIKNFSQQLKAENVETLKNVTLYNQRLKQEKQKIKKVNLKKIEKSEYI